MASSARKSDKERIKQAKRRRLLNENNFAFDRPFDSSDLEKQPPHRRLQLQTIENLGRTRLLDYLRSIDPDETVRPWRRERLRKAERIRDLALRLQETNATEYSWRAKVEELLLEPFSVESACETCTGRFWAPELRTRLKTPEELGLAYEDARQRSCTCPDRDQRKSKVNWIFQDDLDKTSSYPSDVQEVAPNGERPDRIIGLRQTPKLQAAVEHFETELTMTPYRKDDEYLVFPFLVLEAKADNGNSGNSVSNTKRQSSLAILEVLRIQSELAEKAGTASRDDYQGSIAWFIAFRGEQWQIYMAFTEKVNDRLEQKVRLIWEVNLTKTDGALGMILIVEHLVDWARTEYRPIILQSLEALGAPIQGTSLRETASAHRDTVRIASPRQATTCDVVMNDDSIRHFTHRPKSEDIVKIESRELPTSIPSLMNKNPSNARERVLFQHRSLLIQRPIVKTTIQRVLQRDHIPKKRLNKILRDMIGAMWNTLQFTYTMTNHELNTLEQLWLGEEHRTQFILDKSEDQEFRVAFTVEFFTDRYGQPVRSLRYIAFPKDYRDDLYSNWSELVFLKTQLWHDASSIHIFDTITNLVQSSAQSTIRACLGPKCVFLHPILFPEGCNSHYESHEPNIRHQSRKDAKQAFAVAYYLSIAFSGATLFNHIDYLAPGTQLMIAIEDVGESRNLILDTLAPPNPEYCPILYELPTNSQPLFKVFLFQDAIYEDSFKFESLLSSALEELPGALIEGLQELRRCFPGMTDEERCRLLVESQGQLFTEISDEGESE